MFKTIRVGLVVGLSAALATTAAPALGAPPSVAPGTPPSRRIVARTPPLAERFVFAGGRAGRSSSWGFWN